MDSYELDEAQYKINVGIHELDPELANIILVVFKHGWEAGHNSALHEITGDPSDDLHVVGLD